MSTGKICCLVLLTLGVLAVVVALVVILTQPKCGPQHYLHGAVAADSETCSVIGRDILKSGGTAVDAAIAGLICTSVMNPQSSGLGGGVVFTIYNASTEPCNFVSYQQSSSATCITLLHRAHMAMHSSGAWYTSPLICDGQRLLEPGETFRWPALQQTLKAVAENGATAFYEGQIGQALVEDIRKAGSGISLEDLQAYKAEVSSALNITLNSHTTVFSPGPPMGGAVLMFILKILEEYKLHEASLATPKEKVETYHRIAEALKFGNMLKPHMSDPAFSDTQSHKGSITLSASALGEKPPSAMVPSILISKTGDMLVIGGAGGAWIISATAMVSEQEPHSNASH
ncbi:hypothetical protein llap_8829 [Limosa lapponica baueri]|uniref:Gamma-glutamyltransferase 5 n=1 Tax=Limosa lapponica baueri TaxID=1758121 RepID=A0A2I0U451_LIMLA|nr:hypothetical protein llap_8829 [Limosa lapponica baueri]